ncbi:DUF2088 domain-containing protein [Telmatocola sphagniphila]|uniref:DUF2088 domain-containing protein n=1 Tax=Telmatocola sphagniphila TaxID=1123043 RepID=A0A8E6B731_9BACT|nr:lactate racemase domain-containing protein [Telmatocola sphagniphila]QVL33102.1 DUF2088 domain-containing protein [Telmatocola sphagniphila]
MSLLEIQPDGENWSIQLPEGTSITEPVFAKVYGASISDVVEAFRESLDHPIRFEPLYRALTPDDRITIVFDASIPHADVLLGELKKYLLLREIDVGALTILMNREAGAMEQQVALQKNFPELKFEILDPTDRTQMAYLATTQKGRRVYLHRSLLDADQVILVAHRGYDCLLGQTGAESNIFPLMSDSETKLALRKQLRADCPSSEPWPILEEAREVAWLLGIPFLVHVFLDSNDQITAFKTGIAESLPDIAEEFDELSHGKLASPVDAFVVNLPGNQKEFRDLAQAALSASRVLEPAGCLILLTGMTLSGEESVKRIAGYSSPREALKKLPELEESGDPQAIFCWAQAVQNRRVYLYSDLDAPMTESLFATKLENSAQLERLLQSMQQITVWNNPQQYVFEVDSASSK